MTQNKDFLIDFGERHKIEKNDLNPYVMVRILTFEKDKKGNISSNLHGKPVFQDRNSDEDIKEGETWVCKVNTSKINYYFASTIVRIDNQFYFDLRRDQIEAIADHLWENNPDMIQPILEDKYRDIVDAKINEAVSDAITESKKQIEELKTLISEHEKKDAENRLIILSLQEELEKASDTPRAIARVPTEGQFAQALPPSTVVIKRIGPDVLSSDEFTSHRYFAHFSADQKILLIRPHEEGNIVCDVSSGSISLGGLGKISYYTGPEDVRAEYSPQYGGFVMRI